MIDDFSNIEAEQSFLGAIMMNEDAIARIVPQFNAGCFSQELHRKLYAAMLAMIEDGIRPTPIALKTKFTELENPYLAALAANSATLVNVEGLSKLLFQLSQRRFVNASLEAIIARPPADSVTDIACNLSETLHNITTGDNGLKIKTAYDVGNEVYLGVMNGRKPYLTGFRRLDSAMGGGVYAGKAYGFCARKKTGKTMLMGSLSYNLNRDGVKHMFVCAEMGSAEIHQRLLAREMQAYASYFRIGNNRPDDFEKKLGESVAKMPNNIIYCDAPGVNFDRLRLSVANAVARHGIKGFILDYWQLVGGKNSNESEAYHLGQVAQWIADVCKQYDIWAIVAAQINQEGNTRGGEGMRLAFDQVYQIHRHGGDDNNPNFWLEMMDTRYTAWADVGDEYNAGMVLREKGLYFDEPEII